MALNDSSLEQRILDELEANGIKTTGEHAKAHIMAKAVAKAVVAEIQANAQVTVAGGSSAGSYQVK